MQLKKSFFIALHFVLVINIYAQNDTMYVMKNGNAINKQSIKQEDLDSIKILEKDMMVFVKNNLIVNRQSILDSDVDSIIFYKPTPKTLPVITTTSITSITTITAMSGGTITSNGGLNVIDRGVCWGTSHNPTKENSKSTNGTGIGTFKSSISALTANTIYYVRAYATNGVGTAYGNEEIFTTLQKLPDNTVIDYDGNIYNTVTIGTQVWMKENLKTTHYSDGTAIPLVNTDSKWNALTLKSRAYCWYNDDIKNSSKYGALYPWVTAMNGAQSATATPSGIQGVCPSSWHLPSDAEWAIMENYLADNGYNYDGSIGGAPMKIALTLASIDDWISSSAEATVGNTDYPEYRNKSGFTALPGGFRYYDGQFRNQGTSGRWWTSTQYDTFDANRRVIIYSEGHVYRNEGSKREGYSVRCVKD